MDELLSVEKIENRIHAIRGQKVILDYDLAELYRVETKHLKRQVNRNIDRFPGDFLIKMNKSEYNLLRYQLGTLKQGKHAKYLPYAFTEQGVAMLSSVLKSPYAIEINILIMRAFVKLRKVLAINKDLSCLFKELKQKVDKHDVEIGLVIKAIEKMIIVEKKPKAKIGFNI